MVVWHRQRIDGVMVPLLWFWAGAAALPCSDNLHSHHTKRLASESWLAAPGWAHGTGSVDMAPTLLPAQRL